MGPSTTTQRLDLTEEKLSDLEETTKTMIEKGMATAMEALRHTLIEVLMEEQGVATKKLGTEFEAMTARFEGRINQSREYHETLINMIRSEQLKFQTEVKSTLIGMQSLHVSSQDKLEGSVNNSGFIAGSHNSTLGGIEDLGKGSGVRNLAGGNYIGRGPSGGPQPGGSNSNWRYKKLDMPVFDGIYPDGWILQVERYFFYRMTEEEMLEAAAVAMEGDTLRWYQWKDKRRPIRRWADFKVFVLRQFRRKFIEIAAPLERISENMLLGHFVNGLKDEIKAEVRLLNPVNLVHAMELAVRVEEKYRVNAIKKTGLGSIKTSGHLMYSRGPSTLQHSAVPARKITLAILKEVTGGAMGVHKSPSLLNSSDESES
ncbi:hypothetical protein AgCh_038219 [Apium graveolens]